MQRLCIRDVKKKTHCARRAKNICVVLKNTDRAAEKTDTGSET